MDDKQHDNPTLHRDGDDRAAKRKRSASAEDDNYDVVNKSGDDVPHGCTNNNSNNDQSSLKNKSTDGEEDVSVPSNSVGGMERREEKAKSSTLDILKKLASEGDEIAMAALAALATEGSAVDHPKEVTSHSTSEVLQPTLVRMPEGILINILQYAQESYDMYRKDLLAVERTCKVFRDLLAKDETWGQLSNRQYGMSSEYEYAPTLRERAFISMSLRNIRKYQKSDGDILLEYLGGADGVRRAVALLLKKMDPSGITYSEGNCIDRGQYKISLRGDTIRYLTEIIQGHIITRLEKAHRIAIDKLRPGDGYPQITSSDLRLLDALDHDLTHCSIAQGHHACRTVKCSHTDWMWPLDNCRSDEEILSSKERGKLVRALAYRAGVVKMSGEAFSIIETEILHHLAMVTAHAYVECFHQLPDDPLYVNTEQEYAWAFLDEDFDHELRIEAGMNYYANYCPPLKTDSDGKINYIIIPRLIKNAALRMGIIALTGFGEFGRPWAPINDEERDKEKEEEMDRYYLEEEESEPEPEPEPEPESDESSVISLLTDESFDSDGGENNTGTNTE